MTSQELFNLQLRKGREGEDAFRIMANVHYDEVNDYTNYEMWKDIQEKGIDFGVKKNTWSNEITVDVKTNLYYQDNEYYKGYVFNIEYEKWANEKFNKHNREVELGWVQDSKASRIYHYERGTMNYLYYDLDEMRSFIFREWDRPNGWLQKFPNSYVASYKSDYARIIPIKINDKRFKHLIRKIEIEGI
tara:strand:- start:82 stop:648 length:567 start_codon:yes stop_codon:yes gene_type:complete